MMLSFLPNKASAMRTKSIRNKMLTPDEEIVREMMASTPSHRNILPSAETRELSERKLAWPEIGGTIDDRFEIKTLEPSDSDNIEQTARIYRLYFPELFGGVYEDLHFPARYSKLLGQMKILVLQDNMQTGRVASAWALTSGEANMSVEFSVTVTDPYYRGRGLCGKFTKKIDGWVEEAGAELGIAYCATFQETTQRIFSDLGFEKQALLRGFILANAGGSRYARDNVVMYTKFYNNASLLCPLEIRLLR